MQQQMESERRKNSPVLISPPEVSSSPSVCGAVKWKYTRKKYKTIRVTRNINWTYNPRGFKHKPFKYHKRNIRDPRSTEFSLWLDSPVELINWRYSLSSVLLAAAATPPSSQRRRVVPAAAAATGGAPSSQPHPLEAIKTSSASQTRAELYP